MPFIESDGARIKYHIIGRGKPLIFISGLGMDHRVWLYQASHFFKKSMVVLFDNRGIGESTYDGERFSTYTLARDVVNLMDNLGIDKANIIGSSLGGMIAQEVAINFPDRVDNLVLSSTTAKLERKARRGEFFKNLGKIISGEVEILIDADPEHPIFNRAINYILQNAYSREFLIRNKSFAEKLAKDYFSKENYHEILLRQVGAALRHDTRNKLKLIKAKTLILSGTDDRIIPAENGEKLAKGIRISQFVKIEGGTHGLHLERTEEFNRYLEDFILE